MQKIFFLKREDCFLNGESIENVSEQSKRKWLKENYEEGEIHYYLKRGWNVAGVNVCNDAQTPGVFVVIEKN